MRKKIEITKEELIEYYVNQRLTTRKIAKKYGCDKGVINRRLREYEIPIIDVNEINKINISEEELIKLYVNQKLNGPDIAEKYGCSPKTIYNYLNKYGIPIRNCSEAAQTKTCLEKRKNTMLENHGVEYPKQTHIKNLAIWNDPLLFKQYLEYFEVKNGRKPKSQEVADFFNVDIPAVNRRVKEFRYGDLVERVKSAFQLKVEDWLKQHNIEFTNEFYLKGKKYDIKVGDILIEANPNSTHCIRQDEDLKYQSCQGNIDYHMEKTKLATDNGYTCINMFQWNLEDIDNVLRFLNQENYNRIVHPIRPHIIIDLDIENPHWYPEYEPMTWYEHIKYVDMKTKWSNEYEEGLYPIYGAGYLKMKLKETAE